MVACISVCIKSGVGFANPSRNSIRRYGMVTFVAGIVALYWASDVESASILCLQDDHPPNMSQKMCTAPELDRLVVEFPAKPASEYNTSWSLLMLKERLFGIAKSNV